MFYLKKSLSKGTHDYLTVFSLGVIYEYYGKLKEALYYYVDTIEKEPTFVEAFCKIGEIFF